jgi:hypothetical protein
MGNNFQLKEKESSDIYEKGWSDGFLDSLLFVSFLIILSIFWSGCN